MNSSWLPGYCATADTYNANCRHARMGARHAPPGSTADDCAARCLKCENCRFVSFTPPLRSEPGDCSWYRDCDMTALGRQFNTGHRTLAVRSHVTPPSARRVHHKPRAGPPPTALIVFHVAKTGGTALTTLLNGFSWHKLKAQLEARY